jgi:DNA-binding IclR family transcriptional regulator
VLLNNTTHGARHAVLPSWCASSARAATSRLSAGSEVLYLDRVETPAPLRFYLHPGSRVPAHCSATASCS